MKIVCVELPAETATDLWGELQPYVEAALEYDVTRSTSLEDIQRQIDEGWARVLICADQETGAIESATIIQSHVDRNDERILHVIATAGNNSSRWLNELIDKLEEIATENECAGITMLGRPGWTRKLKRYGFRTQQVLMRMGVDNGRNEQIEPIEPAAEPGQLAVVR